MFDQAFPVFSSTSVHQRGLGWTSGGIGLAMSLGGIGSLGMLIVYPYMIRRTGLLLAAKIFFGIVVVIALVFPFNYEVSLYAPIWVAYVSVSICLLIRSCCIEVAFTTQNMIMNNVVRPEHNGAANGITYVMGCLGWILAPLLGGSIFSFSLQSIDWLANAGQTWVNYVPLEKTVFFVMAIMASIALVLVWSIDKRADKSLYSSEIKEESVATV